ncbi:MAG: transposase [Chloroflexota bacterium]
MKPHPQRKSPRLKGYDYTSDGAYFVTICTQERYLLFGNVVNSEMRHDSLGALARHHWLDLPNHFDTVELDYFVVMPNHFHGIVVINNYLYEKVETGLTPTTNPIVGDAPVRPTKTKYPTLGLIIGSFKAAVTREARKQNIFTGKIWQRNYHDHIIRDEDDLNRLRQYVVYNPAKWEEDRFYRETNL